jgi:hypothetical protein
MNNRTVRMFSAMIIVALLMFVGDVIWSHASRTASVAQPGSAQVSAHAISLDQASIIAQDTAPHVAIIGVATLTSYNGTDAYAVPMDTGMIYVQATTGRVLANTLMVALGGAEQN